MKLDLQKFFQDAKSVKLTPEEKSGILGHLTTYMANNPVRNMKLAGHKLWSNQLINFKLTFLKPMPIAIIIALLISGGASMAAENALPGDNLYPIKVSINENVRGWLALSDQAEAKLQTKLAERRLEEAEKLAVQSKLSAETRAQLEESFQKFADRVEIKVSKFKERNPEKAAEITANFEIALRAHANVLEKISAATATAITGFTTTEAIDIDTTPENIINAVEINSLILKIKAESREAREQGNSFFVGEGANKKEAPESFIRALAQTHLEEARIEINKFRRLIDGLDSNAELEFKARAEASLKLAEQIWTDAKLKYEAREYYEALSLARASFSTAFEARLTLQASLDGNIEIIEVPKKDRFDDLNCIQVITKARHKITGKIKEFPTPCDIPDDWEIENEINGGGRTMPKVLVPLVPIVDQNNR